MDRMIWRYTTFAIDLNALLDSGKHLDLDETKSHIRDGSLFDWLSSQFDVELPAQQFAADGIEWHEAIDFFQSKVDAVNARRKFGVKNNGLALLVAYCIQGVQERIPQDS